MTTDRLSRSAVLVTVLYGDEDVPGVRAMLEGVAPDQNLCFLLLEQEHDDHEGRHSSRQRLVGASVLRQTDAVHGGPLERSAIAFAPRGSLAAVSPDLKVTLRQRLLDEQQDTDPADCHETVLHAVTSAIGRRGCVVSFSGGRDQLPAAPRLRDMLGAHDGMVLIQHELGGPFVRLAPEIGAETPIEVVVQPAELSYTLLEHAEPLIAELRPPVVSPRFTDVEEQLPGILQRVLEVTGQDFSGYKPATMIRRTIRRLHLSGAPDATAYLARLQEERAEVGRLFRDLLVGVTAFFRDPAAFEILSRRVLERLATSDVSTPARVWVAGCSTGEEVYTLAMLLDELADSVPSMRRVQLFATDVDEVALRTAREGRYPASRVANLTPERIARFFVRTGQQFRVTQAMRDRVVFSRHDLTRDAPFSNLDLIVCRNVLIYLDDEVRDRLLPRFHDILRPGGTLFLGPSESLGAHDSLFCPLDAHHRLFTRGNVPSRLKLSGELSYGRAGTESAVGGRDQEDIVRRMRSVLASHYAPRAAVVTEDGHVVAVSGDLSPILAVRDGAFVNSLTHLVHDGLRQGTRTALREARLLGERVEHAGGVLQGPAGREAVTVVAEPLPGAEADGNLYLVVFRRDALLEFPVESLDTATPDSRIGRVSTAMLDRLESDLSATRAELLRVSYDSEIVNEELKAANEELTSMNEELQSGIEALEASRQELERVNGALSESNSDLTNLLASTGIPTIFLDDMGTVRRFNPASSRVYNVSPADVGRPIAHFTHNAAEMPPIPAAADVLARREPVEHEVRMRDGTVYLRRVQPYESSTGERSGIVVTFTDVTEREQARHDLRESSLRLRQVIDAMFAFVGLLDLDGTLLEANSEPLKVTGLRREDVIGLPFWDTAWWTHDEAVRTRLQESFARALTGDVVRYDEKIRASGGDLITIDFMLRPVERDGRIVCVVPSGVDVTHRVATEQRLRAQHDLTRAITQNATTAILLVDMQGTIDLANPSATRMLGYPDSELLGTDLHALVHRPEDVARTQCPGASCEVAQACVGDHSLREFETVFIGRDGRAVPVAVSASAVAARETNGSDSGLPLELRVDTGTVFEIRDLSDVVRARRELAEGEAQFRQMADVIPQMAWIAKPDGEIFWYNRQFYTYTGVAPEEVEGWGWTRLQDPDMLPIVVERWRQSIATGTPFDMVFPLLGADGQYRPFLTRVNPLRGENGKIRLWFGTNTDISDERERSEKLRRNERELYAITDALPDVIVRLDRERRHVFANAAMERVTGHRLSAVLGRTSRELGFPESLCEQLDAVLGRVFASGEVETQEFECESGGTHRAFSARITPELDESGDITAVLVVARDRTVEVEAASALREADRRKDEFLATLAHELRNPLAPMRNGLEILRLTHNGDERGASTQRLMERQVAHMTRLIDDLLDVSRIRLGKLRLRLGPVDLNQVLADALEINENAWQDAGHELVRVIPDEPLRIRADQDRVAQVVSNLVNNAIKYTPDGGRIEVTLGREGKDAVIRVSDNGIGIAPDKLEHVFELFTQVPREGGDTVGLGIGLALVRQLVELHQGSVIAESEGLGTGSRFTVRLPAAVLSHGPLPSAEDDRAATDHALRILVVDDNEDSADSLVTMLELLGHGATSAHSGLEALEAARTSTPDLVFADIGLPDITGYELAIAIRENPSLARVVLVALTGWGSDEHRRRSVDSGFDYHLTKPAAMDVIRRILARVTLELGHS